MVVCRDLAYKDGMRRFDVTTKEWSAVECYGSNPCSRSAMGE